uniref:Uncharacterized protein n=1 Tax=Opuntia streptacantha TaxID=393608 RepID=A0A7C9B1R8_OPUST
MLRRSIDASCDGSSPSNVIIYWGKSNRYNHHRHADKISHANFLPISCISNERVNCETLSYFLNQPPSCSLCLQIIYSWNDPCTTKLKWPLILSFKCVIQPSTLPFIKVC